MRKKIFVLFGGVLLLVALSVSCFSFQDVASITYAIRVEEIRGVKEGTYSLSFTPQGSEGVEVHIHFALGDEEFSTTLTTEEENLAGVLFSSVLTNPSLSTVMGPIMASQTIYLALLENAQGKLQEGFLWRTKDEEGREMEISVSSRETRFGREALWIESKTNGVAGLRMLMEEKTLIPFIIDITDPEFLEEGQKRVYLEVENIEWRGTASAGETSG